MNSLPTLKQIISGAYEDAKKKKKKKEDYEDDDFVTDARHMKGKKKTKKVKGDESKGY